MPVAPQTKRNSLIVVLAVLTALGIFQATRDEEPDDVTAAAPVTAGDTAPAVYDPTKLLEAGVPAVEVYEKEPRAGRWADLVEASIGNAMGRDLNAMVPEAGMVMKCKTMSCLIGIDAPATRADAALAVTKFLTIAPWVVDLPPEEDGTQRWLFFQEPRFADPDVFLPWYAGVRKRALAEMREGKRPNTLPVDKDQLPTE